LGTLSLICSINVLNPGVEKKREEGSITIDQKFNSLQGRWFKKKGNPGMYWIFKTEEESMLSHR